HGEPDTRIAALSRPQARERHGKKREHDTTDRHGNPPVQLGAFVEIVRLPERAARLRLQLLHDARDLRDLHWNGVLGKVHDAKFRTSRLALVTRATAERDGMCEDGRRDRMTGP